MYLVIINEPRSERNKQVFMKYFEFYEDLNRSCNY